MCIDHLPIVIKLQQLSLCPSLPPLPNCGRNSPKVSCQHSSQTSSSLRGQVYFVLLVVWHSSEKGTLTFLNSFWRLNAKSSSPQGN